MHSWLLQAVALEAAVADVLAAVSRALQYSTYMAWVQLKHPAVKRLGASAAHGVKSPTNLGNTDRKKERKHTQKASNRIQNRDKDILSVGAVPVHR
jgi:hypothetical protein